MRINSARGFTLVEIIVSIVAFGILMALMVNVFAPEVVRGADSLYSMRAAELGQSYLEEILGKRFAENSPPGNVTRCNPCDAIGIDPGETAGVQTTFDDVDDYNTLTPALNAQPLDQSGNVRAGYENFHVWVSVANDGASVGLNAGDAKRIEVTILDPRGAQYIFSAYKTNF